MIICCGAPLPPDLHGDPYALWQAIGLVLFAAIGLIFRYCTKKKKENLS